MLETLVQYRLGSAGSTFSALLGVWQSTYLSPTFATPDGWHILVPLAAHLVYNAEQLPDLHTTWLAALVLGKGPLAAILPFVILLALSRSQSVQHTAETTPSQHTSPQAPVAQHPSSRSSSRSRSRRSVYDVLRLRKRQRKAASLATVLLRRLAAALAADLDAVSEACLLSLSRAALQCALCEPFPLHADSSGPVNTSSARPNIDANIDANAQSPAQAALEIVMEGLARNRSTLAVRLDHSVDPHWDGSHLNLAPRRQPTGLGGRLDPLDVPASPCVLPRPALRGFILRRECGQVQAVRCVMCTTVPVAPRQYSNDAIMSMPVTFELGDRALSMRVDLGTAHAKTHVSLYVHLTPTEVDEDCYNDSDSEDCFADQLYAFEASAVPWGQASVLAAGGSLPAGACTYTSAWTAQSGLGMVGSGDPWWAPRGALKAAFSGDKLTVCVDVRLAF